MDKNVSFCHVPYSNTDGIDHCRKKADKTNNEALVEDIAEMLELPNDKTIYLYFDNGNRIKNIKARVCPKTWEITTLCQKVKNNLQGEEWDHLIYISRCLRESDDEIYRTLYFAHEFQHIIQYEADKRIWILGEIFYRSLNTEENPFRYFQIPMEYEAERTAKNIMIEKFGQNRVKEWINKKIHETQKPDEIGTLKDLDSIKTDSTYCVLEESQRLYQQCKKRIRDSVGRLRGKACCFRGEPFVKALKEYYDYDEIERDDTDKEILRIMDSDDDAE